MACHKDYEYKLHQYLDGDMTETERDELYQHLDTCEECAIHYKELKKSVMFVQSASHIEAPFEFTEGVLKNLPAKKKTKWWKKWMRQHPVFTAASIFTVLMAASLFFSWMEQSDEVLTVAGSQNVEIDHETGTVIVPEGKTVEGDLYVRNGHVEVKGEVTGDLTVINGEQYLASAGRVAGEIEEVDQALEWIWYHTKRIANDVFSLEQEDE
ncbi:Transmembrane transcriptional regulator (anti-sigma factor RsiW) [Alteribacillus persepolensis]|uniref:Anti-sigma-W factor RsiW n=1 Tax=Alteribacillus persepolensis TaxID=568899 RepID=A0A1G8JHY9_9BACI|nr:anti-sigma factor [Alteribacillus persepolensis]SDI30637.1 Transmembrane transcriptional regulator (anti-sigma factor RsiW) [Alteribacillus persepolensis]